MNTKPIALFMKAQNRDNSYHLSEEIAVRKMFKSLSPDYIADCFNNLYRELSPDIHAQGRLVDIGLRYEYNTEVHLAAARKIRNLLDAQKILLIPAHIDLASPPVAEAIAKAIITIRAEDPRRYFLERGCSHKNPAVQRICRAALSYYRYDRGIEQTAEPALLQDTIDARLEKRIARQETALPDRPHTKTPARTLPAPANPVHEKAYGRMQESNRVKIPKNGIETPKNRTKTGVKPAVQVRTEPNEDLIGLIGAHIADPRFQVRLKWVKRIGEIPARLDAHDDHKIGFIGTGLQDAVQAVCVEAVAQIAFLIHDSSKLALLRRIFEIQPELMKTKAAKSIIAGLPAEIQKQLENGLKKTDTGAANDNRTSGKTGNGPATGGKQTGTATQRGAQEKQDTAEKIKIDPVEIRIVSDIPGTAKDGNGKTAEETRQKSETAAARGKDKKDEDRDTGLTGEDRTEAAQIIADLDFSAEALAEMTGTGNTVGDLVRNLSSDSGLPKTDNYFLRHTAVLHVKDLHAEALRYQLYLSVLEHDPKEIVRQASVHEAVNLHPRHRETILHLALNDPAWQVRCVALEDLFPLVADAAEQKKILVRCAQDTDYHVRQKVSENLARIAGPARQIH